MALRIEDIIKLKGLRGLQLVAGAGGTGRYVASAGILDYEYVCGAKSLASPLFDEGSFVISSLLFAKDQPELILPAVKALHEAGVSGFAYKTIFFDSLPPEATAYAEEHQFPIFRFGGGSFFENIIFEVMDAVQQDDARVLTNSRIQYILDHHLSAGEAQDLVRSLSLKFRQYACCAYIKPSAGNPPLNIQQLLRSYYHSKELREKVMLGSYEGGIFLLMTAASPSPDAFQTIYRSYLEVSGLNHTHLAAGMSRVHPSHWDLPSCIQESFWAWKALSAEHTASQSGSLKKSSLLSFQDSGIWQFLVPLHDQSAMTVYTDSCLMPLLEKPDLLETASVWIQCGGDLVQAADLLSCHQNTVRYRINRIRELIQSGCSSTDDTGTIHSTSLTDFQLYERLSAALKIHQLNRLP